jgi:hypothetical protein
MRASTEGDARVEQSTPSPEVKVGRGVILRCSAVDCAYNEKFKCVAENVTIVRHQDHADCTTYTENQHKLYRVGM